MSLVSSSCEFRILTFAARWQRRGEGLLMNISTYPGLPPVSPEEKNWELRKWKLICCALAAESFVLSILILIAVWGQEVSTAGKLYIIFGGSFAAVMLIITVLLRLWTTEEINRNFWVPLILWAGVLVCGYGFCMAHASTPTP